MVNPCTQKPQAKFVAKHEISCGRSFKIVSSNRSNVFVSSWKCMAPGHQHFQGWTIVHNIWPVSDKILHLWWTIVDSEIWKKKVFNSWICALSSAKLTALPLKLRKWLMAEMYREISPSWMSLDIAGDKSTLVRVMAWYRQATIQNLN